MENKYTIHEWLDKFKKEYFGKSNKLYMLREFYNDVVRFKLQPSDCNSMCVSDIACIGYPHCKHCIFHETMCNDILVNIDIDSNSNTYIINSIINTLNEVIESCLFNTHDSNIVDSNGWSLEIIDNFTYSYKNNHLKVYIELHMEDDKVSYYKHWVTVDLCNKNVANDYSTSYTFKDKEHIKKIKKHFGIILEDNLLCM